LLVELGLNRLEQRPIKDGWLLAWEDRAFVSDLADIEAVAQESGRDPRPNGMPPMVRPLDNGRTLVLIPVVRRSASNRFKLESSR
jgi:hypothetical protein